MRSLTCQARAANWFLILAVVRCVSVTGAAPRLKISALSRSNTLFIFSSLYALSFPVPNATNLGAKQKIV